MEGPSWTKKLPLEGPVEVWSAWLDQRPSTYAACKSTLSAAELERFDRYGDREAADHFAIRRGTIRHLLATAVGQPLLGLEIDTDELGKPYLANRAIEFNVSSSRVLAVFAVCSCGEVGVDLEWHDPALEFSTIAYETFSSREIAALDGKPQAAYFQVWALKEACAKALGIGMQARLSNLEVMFSNEVSVTSSLSLKTQTLDLSPGYSGAVAYWVR